MYINNHTAVWGSYYDIASGKWGYACCHSTIHVSYCTGLAGIEANKASSAQNLLASAPPASSSQATPSRALLDDHRDRSPKRDAADHSSVRGDSRKAGNWIAGGDDIRIDETRLEKALREGRKRKERQDDDDDESGKKKKISSMSAGNHEITEEELGKSNLFFVSLFKLIYNVLQRRIDDYVKMQKIPCSIIRTMETFNCIFGCISSMCVYCLIVIYFIVAFFSMSRQEFRLTGSATAIFLFWQQRIPFRISTFR